MYAHRSWRSSRSTPAVGSSRITRRGPVEQGAREQQPAAHAARQVVGVVVGLRGEVERHEHLVGARGARRRGSCRSSARAASATRAPARSGRAPPPGARSRSPAAPRSRPRPRPPGRTRGSRPPSGRVRPTTLRMRVVLPAPLGPSRPKNEPSGIARSRPASASTPPGKVLWTPSQARAGAPSAITTGEGIARGPPPPRRGSEPAHRHDGHGADQVVLAGAGVGAVRHPQAARLGAHRAPGRRGTRPRPRRASTPSWPGTATVTSTRMSARSRLGIRSRTPGQRRPPDRLAHGPAGGRGGVLAHEVDAQPHLQEDGEGAAACGHRRRP